MWQMVRGERTSIFDYDVPCEPTWSQWFDSYREYLNHYAKLAEETGCVMLVIGCELVNSDRRKLSGGKLFPRFDSITMVY